MVADGAGTTVYLRGNFDNNGTLNQGDRVVFRSPLSRLRPSS